MMMHLSAFAWGSAESDVFTFDLYSGSDYVTLPEGGNLGYWYSYYASKDAASGVIASRDADTGTGIKLVSGSSTGAVGLRYALHYPIENSGIRIKAALKNIQPSENSGFSIGLSTTQNSGFSIIFEFDTAGNVAFFRSNVKDSAGNKVAVGIDEKFYIDISYYTDGTYNAKLTLLDGSTYTKSGSGIKISDIDVISFGFMVASTNSAEVFADDISITHLDPQKNVSISKIRHVQNDEEISEFSSGNVKAEATVSSLWGKSEKLSFVTALYEGNELSNVKLSEINVTDTDTVFTNEISVTDASEYRIRSFIFSDDMKIWESSLPVTSKQQANLIFYDGADYAVLNGKKNDISSCRAYSENSKLYIPLMHFADGIGVKLETNGDSVTVFYNEKQYDFDISDSALKKKDGIMYISAEKSAEIYGETYWNGMGLLMLGTQEELNFREDEKQIMSTIGNIIYERPSGEEIIARLIQKNPDNHHPRLMATAEDFARIAGEVKTSQIKSLWFDACKAETERVMALTPIVWGRQPCGIRMRDQSNQIADIVTQCGFMYNVTGEEKYAQRAWTEIEALCNFPDWNPYHFLDVGQFMMAMGVGYDWLYNYMTPEQRKLMRENILQKAYVELMMDYNDDPSRVRTYKWSTTDQPNNWNFVCNSGAVLSALAIGDEEPEVCGVVLENALRSVEGAINQLAPDGAWYEGPGYWTLSIETFVEMLSSMETALGTDYGFMKAPGVAQTGYYPSDVSSTYGSFNYSDSGVITVNAPELYYFARVLGDDGLKTLRTNILVDNSFDGTYRDLIYCVGDVKTGTVNLTPDKKYSKAEVAVMRSGWEKNNEFFAAIHAGNNDAPHGHLDVGTFVIDAFGDRFITDLGLEDYNLPGGWNKYRNRAQGHNTLLISPGMELYDQLYEAHTYVDKFASNDISAMARVDMTPAYANKAHKALRGMKMTNNRKSVLIQDEVSLIEESTLYWHVHTPASVTISDDGKKAILDISGNKMVARILSEGTFTVSEAKPMDGTPTVEGQNENKGISRLAIKLDNTKDATIAVTFTPWKYASEGYAPEIIALDEWILD